MDIAVEETSSSQEIAELPNPIIDFEAIQRAMDEIDLEDDDNDEEADEPDLMYIFLKI